MGIERDAAYYDHCYFTSRTYTKPAKDFDSPVYQTLWRRTAEWIQRLPGPLRYIIDLGCGPGHFAEVVRDAKLLYQYIGFDFSPVAIQQAQQRLGPNFTFIQGDLRSVGFQRPEAVYVAHEFLEHVTDDVGVLTRIPLGAPVAFSVPSFNDPSHVRSFAQEKDVLDRYENLVEIREIVAIPSGTHKSRLYASYGKRRQISSPPRHAPLSTVKLRLPTLDSPDHSHRGHLIQALSKHPAVSVVGAEAEADFDLTVQFRQDKFKGPAKFRLYPIYFDPHSACHEIDLCKLLDPKMLRVLDKHLAQVYPGKRHWFEQEWPKLMAKRGNPRWIPTLDQCDFVTTRFPETYQEILKQLKKAKTLVVPYYLPPDIFHTTLKEPRFLDVFFIGCVAHGWYPIRSLALRGLSKNLPDIYGNRTPPAEISYYLAPFRSRKAANDSWGSFHKHQLWYADCLRHTKVFIFDGGVFSYPVGKYFEAMACGALVLAPIPKDAKHLGFVDGETMVEIHVDNWEERLRYYLGHPAERERIIRNAFELSKQWKSVDPYVDTLKRLLV